MTVVLILSGSHLRQFTNIGETDSAEL
jgi:hypothetical protein